MEENKLNNLVLEDGSNIAVIGGGPAGSFFTYFALDFADRYGTDINIDIIEAKNFNCFGPQGCNNCGGIISESLVQTLSTEGIVIPSNVIRRGIETYTLHFEQGDSVIETPFHEQRIASVYRGLGPKGMSDSSVQSFDNFLIELCKDKGAKVIEGRVIEAERKDDGIILRTNQNFEKKYDLVVGAVGLNEKAFEIFESICPSFVPPKQTKTYICEFGMDNKTIDEYFGHSMHVFLLNLPNIKFGALIPKSNYVTLVLLGSEINKEIVSLFIESDAVKGCFPKGFDLKNITTCNCFPSINVKAAKTAYGDRMILIGDSSSSKLYKNGIGAAYITAKAAAKAAVFNGISKKDFNKLYQPVCNELNTDNAIGKFIFLVTTVIQKSGLLKRGVLNMVISEQKKANEKRRMSSVLWDTFTGSATYKSIFIRVVNPIVLAGLIWNIIYGIFKTKSK
ncbi:NAD(P)/FAD-dependent oxidoreductase [Bacteroidota bacterium]